MSRTVTALLACLLLAGCDLAFEASEVGCTLDSHCPDDHFCDSVTGAGWCALGERPEGTDDDGDGVTLEDGDCDDTDPANFPGGVEVCDGQDNDCDGQADFADEAGDETDADADGSLGCGDDCDDDEPAVHPGAPELCNDRDDDCDGALPDDELDTDGDGWSDCEGDCDLDDPTVFPDAEEACDETDSDCDGDEVDGFDDTDHDGIPDCVDPFDDNTLLDDDDDGFPNPVDCAPDDPAIYPGAPESCDAVDSDCDEDLADEFDDLDDDGIPDCIDGDADGDGTVAAADCDDFDASSTTLATDGDCDGTVTAEDCDDADPASETIWTDGDCDGFLTADDCDDGDPASTVVATDGDCDGTVTVEDCDDADPASETIWTDGDCDGFLGADDCDDGDPNSTVTADDGDCDGVVTAEDCDDGDPASETIWTDGDCDGLLTAADCDDDDPDSTAVADDAYCDGAETADDCDDGDPGLVSIFDDADCDGVIDCLGTTTIEGVTFVRLCPEPFDMGCTPGQSGCDGDELPAHEVTLTQDFWMGQTEVTQEQWEELMGSTPSRFSPTGPSPACGDDCPVERVDWYEALAYANALSAAEGLQPCYVLSGCGGSIGGGCSGDYSCNGWSCSSVTVDTPTGSVYDCAGYRLPTEAEWEVAARAGTDLRYAGSDVLDDVAWWILNAGSTTHPVATKDPNDWGLFDLSGNVWEWVWDRYDAGWYAVSPASDPEGPSTGGDGTIRGGTVFTYHHSHRVADRVWTTRTTRVCDLGFRLARTFP